MPGFRPIVGDKLRMRVVCYNTQLGQVSENISHWLMEAGTGAGCTLLELAAAQSGFLNALYKAWMPPTCIFSGVSFRNLTAPQTAEVISRANAGVGNAIGDMIPGQVSGLLRLRNLGTGGGNRGRLYVGFPSNKWVESTGDMSLAGKNQLNALATAYSPVQVVVGLNGTAQIGLCVRKASTGAFTNIDQVSAVQLWATQRRRGDYGARNIPDPFA